MCQLCAVKAVQAVQKAEARIWFTPRPGTTFFSGNDIWLYQINEIPTTCEDCKGYEDMASGMGGLNGNTVRSLFPYLMILDNNTIGGQGEGGKGLAHPNCGCRLIRYLGDPEDRVVAQSHVVPKKKETN